MNKELKLFLYGLGCFISMTSGIFIVMTKNLYGFLFLIPFLIFFVLGESLNAQHDTKGEDSAQ